MLQWYQRAILLGAAVLLVWVLWPWGRGDDILFCPSRRAVAIIGATIFLLLAVRPNRKEL